MGTDIGARYGKRGGGEGEMSGGVLRRNEVARCGVCWKWNERLRIFLFEYLVFLKSALGWLASDFSCIHRSGYAQSGA